jgi:hypothetical protein
MNYQCAICEAEYWDLVDAKNCEHEPTKLTGGSAGYYKVRVERPTSGGEPYIAECNDIIEALGMEYDVANAFKAAWRVAALRQGRGKPGQDSPVYDGEKIVFFGQRIIERTKP